MRRFCRLYVVKMLFIPLLSLAENLCLIYGKPQDIFQKLIEWLLFKVLRERKGVFCHCLSILQT